MRIVTTHRKVVILQAELAENPMLSERLRRIFSKTPSLESRESAGHGQVGHACVLRSPLAGKLRGQPTTGRLRKRVPTRSGPGRFRSYLKKGLSLIGDWQVRNIAQHR